MACSRLRRLDFRSEFGNWGSDDDMIPDWESIAAAKSIAAAMDEHEHAAFVMLPTAGPVPQLVKSSDMTMTT